MIWKVTYCSDPRYNIRELAEMFELDYTGVVNHLNVLLQVESTSLKVFKGTVPNRIGNVVVLIAAAPRYMFYKGRYTLRIFQYTKRLWSATW
jgi:hypothetical protein